jgi:hypothetical protein
MKARRHPVWDQWNRTANMIIETLGKASGFLKKVGGIEKDGAAPTRSLGVKRNLLLA